MAEDTKVPSRSNFRFRHFFFRGLTILLPTVLTFWILYAAYGFVKDKIADPLNAGARELVTQFTPWPVPLEEKIVAYQHVVKADPALLAVWQGAGETREWLRVQVRRNMIDQWWKRYQLPLDLIGLMIAVILIYAIGAVLGSFIGNRLYKRGERLLQRLPLIRQVYPSVKQVTDLLLGGNDKELKFSRVVAVEYPRKGLWSVGLVTGDTMRTIADKAASECLTVFIPSSPTPFTGYVITVPRQDTVDLQVTIEEALRFTISGGVIVPKTQQVIRQSIPQA